MKLSMVLEALGEGEFNTLGLVDDTTDSIKPKNIPKIIGHINLGLIDLYTRFPLKIKEISIQQYEEITLYKLSSEYALSNEEGTGDPKYIIDTEQEPFKDDIIRIDSVWDELGNEVPMNEDSQYSSVFTPAYDVLQVPYPEPENALVVLYRALPDSIDKQTEDTTTVDVDIPITYMTALLYYVAHRVYSSLQSTEAQNMAITYFTKYENACLFLLEHGAVNDSNPETNSKPAINGWV